MFKEFKEFAVRGNVVEIAIGIMIGATFGKIINSFVEHLVVPLLSLIANETSKAVTINYGILLISVIDFVIIGFAILLLARAINALRRQQEFASPTTKDCPECMMPVPVQARRCGHCGSDIQLIQA